MPTFGSLFAGIGGIDLGLERAGWTGRWQVEWDDYCQHVLAHHWPDIPRYGDITTVDWSGVERVDLLAGGFPCQPVSSAGKRQAQGDARWLWPEFHRAIRELRPGLVLVENVTNLLAINDGSAFGDVLGDLAASGYDTEWDCVPAAAVGALHERDRVWIVAYADSHGRDAPSSGQGGTEGSALRPALTPREHGRAAGGRPVRGAGASVADADGIGREGERGRGLPDDGDASLRYDAHRRGGPMADAERAGPQGRSGSGVAGARRAPSIFAGGGSALSDPERGRRDGRAPNAERREVGRAAPVEAGSGGGRSIQWLTEPDVGRVAHGVPARVDRLRALGNAVVPQVVEVIGRRLLEVIEQAA